MATNKELQEVSQAQSELIREMQDQIKQYKDTVERMKQEMREGKPAADRQTIEQAMSVLYDPYDVQSPFRIMKDIPPDDEYPEGQALRWLNPRLRSGNWQGWTPLQWGDKYTGENGELLQGLITEAPEFMRGPDQVDSYVRRKDSILGRLDKRIWHSRRVKPVLEDARRRGSLSDGQEVKLGKGIKLTGDGIVPDDEPTKHYPVSSPDVPFDSSTGEGAHRTQIPIHANEEQP